MNKQDENISKNYARLLVYPWLIILMISVGALYNYDIAIVGIIFSLIFIRIGLKKVGLM